MTRFYTFIWNELSTSRSKVLTDLCSGPYIFVPCARVLRQENIVPGVFLSSEDVYWHDSTGSIEQIQMINPTSSKCMDVLPKILSIVYPSLCDLFVKECGVAETPSFHSYLQILLQLSSVETPSNSAKLVFQVFLKWADGMKSQLLGSDDIDYLRESLLNKETRILPTLQDKWASLHPSFGLVCWCDDETLMKEFKHCDDIDFLYFGLLNKDDKELQVSVILKALGIPSISEVVTREAIYDGVQDCSFKASLVNWALPYAQRYIYNIHPFRYCQLKQQTEFGNLNKLQVLVVDHLSTRNVIKRCGGIASKKRSECNSLLQGNILFTRAESDSHSVFMELSRLFFDGTPELSLANFLHMITTMVRSGSINEEQLEFFITNSQNLPKLADKDDSVWALEEDPSKPKRKRGWPPAASWKTTHDMNFAQTKQLAAAATTKQKSNNNTPKEKFEANNWTIENAPSTSSIFTTH